MLLCVIILFSMLFASENCAKVYVGQQTDTGKWPDEQKHAVPMQIAGKSYFFSLNGSSNWFIKPLLADGTLGENTDGGRFLYIYTQSFAFNVKGKQYLYAITEDKYWFLQEILPNGILGKETSRGFWPTLPDVVFPVNVNGEYFVVTLSEDYFYIKELTPNGQVGVVTDSGDFDRVCTLAFPFDVHGRQFFYCYGKENDIWSIYEIEYDGIMGEEVDSGVGDIGHLLYLPFYMHGKTYFYGLTENKKKWFVRELLPGGKMGTEKGRGSWASHYHLMCGFHIDGNQYIYGVDQSKRYIIHKMYHDPPFCPVLLQPRAYCDEESKLKCGIRYPRLERLGNYGASDAACAQFNYIHEYLRGLQGSSYFRTTKIKKNAETSIISYTQFTPYLHKHKTPPVNLTIAVEAEIREKHIKYNDTMESSSVLNRVKQDLNAEQDDEIGYLLATFLGGTNESYNFVPKSPNVNRKVLVAGSRIRAPQIGWHDVESLVGNFTKETNGYVRLSLVVIYGNLLNTRRPTEFWLVVRLHNSTTDKLTSWQGNKAITGYHFRNVPNVACTNLRHEWWNIPY